MSAAVAGPFQERLGPPPARPRRLAEAVPGVTSGPAPAASGPAPRGGLAVWSGAAETGLSGGAWQRSAPPRAAWRSAGEARTAGARHLGPRPSLSAGHAEPAGEAGGRSRGRPRRQGGRGGARGVCGSGTGRAGGPGCGSDSPHCWLLPFRWAAGAAPEPPAFGNKRLGNGQLGSPGGWEVGSPGPPTPPPGVAPTAAPPTLPQRGRTSLWCVCVCGQAGSEGRWDAVPPACSGPVPGAGQECPRRGEISARVKPPSVGGFRSSPSPARRPRARWKGIGLGFWSMLLPHSKP